MEASAASLSLKWHPIMNKWRPVTGFKQSLAFLASANLSEVIAQADSEYIFSRRTYRRVYTECAGGRQWKDFFAGRIRSH